MEPAPTHRALVTVGEPPGQVLAEVPSTRAERVRGLMHRTSVPDGTGMLFVFERSEARVFTMRNVRVPLDLIFMDSLGKVVGFIWYAQPGEPVVGIRRPARIVLETAAGFVARHRVQPGQRAEIVPL